MDCLDTVIEILNPAALGYIGYYHHVFPTRTYIATGLFQLMGGGGRVVTAVILAIITDVSSPDSRTKYFWYLEVADFATQLLAPGMASMLMTSNIWNAFTAGIVVAIIALMIVWVLPETAPSGFKVGQREQNSERVRAHNTDCSPENDELGHTPTRPDWRRPLTLLRSVTSHGSGNKVVKLSFALLAGAMARTSLPILQQFASERLGWTIAQVRKS
jgi:hypothetical protein